MPNISLPKLSEKQIANLLGFYLAHSKKAPAKLKNVPVWQLEIAVRNLKLPRLP